MPKCYVMMPYGGDNQERHDFFQGVFESIIVAAAEKAGFARSDVIREDHRGEPGTIMRNIVNHVSHCDVIIADLTDKNANVFYELGMSHVLHKGSTVLICEQGTETPFDVSGLNIIKYTTNIAAIGEAVEKIAKELKKRLESTNISPDNPVHELNPQLPVHLLDLLETDDNKLKKRIQQLTEANGRYQKLLERYHISIDENGADSETPKNPRELLMMAKTAIPYSSINAINKLSSYVEQGNYDEFFNFFADVLEKGRLTEREAELIAEITERASYSLLSDTVIEIFAATYPDNAEFQTKLAKSYAKRPETRQKAMDVVNTAIGLKRDKDGNLFKWDPVKFSHNNLARLLDTYLSIDAYDELIQVANFFLEKGETRERDMLKRNIFISLIHLKRLDDAKSMIPEIEGQDKDTGYYMIGEYYTRVNDMVNAYHYYEKAMIADPSDYDYPLTMAIHILNENVIREENGICRVPAKKARRVALAFLFYGFEHAVQIDDRNLILHIIQIVRNKINGLANNEQLFQSFLQGKIDEFPYDTVDNMPLDYCLTQIHERETDMEME